MDFKKVGLGTLLLLVSSAILVATGALDSPAAVGLSLSPLGFAGIAYLFGSLGLGRPT